MICDYIYRDVNPDTGAPCDRYPQERNFEPGEFEAIVRKLETSYELVFDQHLDPMSLSFVFEKFRLEDAGLGLELQGLEQRGDLWIVKVGHREGVSRQQVVEQVNTTYEDLRALFEARYQLALEAKEGEIARLSSYHQVLLELQQQVLEKLSDRSSDKTVTVQGEGHRIYVTSQIGDMMENQNINAGGNVDASSGARINTGNITGSILNLGEISGNVTNAINQLPDPDVSDQPNLKALLTQLQQAIETDTDLPDQDKSDLLGEVQALAEVKQTEEPTKREGITRKAMKIFDATLKSLPDTAKLAEACSKLLPLILKALGMGM